LWDLSYVPADPHHQHKPEADGPHLIKYCGTKVEGVCLRLSTAGALLSKEKWMVLQFQRTQLGVLVHYPDTDPWFRSRHLYIQFLSKVERNGVAETEYHGTADFNAAGNVLASGVGDDVGIYG
jgi:hypothetical protein